MAHAVQKRTTYRYILFLSFGFQSILTYLWIILQKLYSENTGKDPDQVVNVDEVLKPLDTPPADIYATVRSVSSVTSDVPSELVME